MQFDTEASAIIWSIEEGRPRLIVSPSLSPPNYLSIELHRLLPSDEVLAYVHGKFVDEIHPEEEEL